MKISLLLLLKILVVIVISYLILSRTIHGTEAFIFGSIALSLSIHIVTGWSPFCDGNCSTQHMKSDEK